MPSSWRLLLGAFFTASFSWRLVHDYDCDHDYDYNYDYDYDYDYENYEHNYDFDFANSSIKDVAAKMQ